MGDQIGRIISIRARVDHVASDHEWLWYLLHVKCFCVLSRYLSPAVEIGICYMLNVCVLSRYLSPVVEIGICYMLNVCVLSRYLSPVVEIGICYMLNVFVFCLVISVQ